MDRRSFAKAAGLAGALSLIPLPASANIRHVNPSPGFRRALLSDGPDPEYEQELMTYGQFVGSWKLVSTDHQNGKVIAGEAYFGWVMQGRAVQDIWISGDEDDPGFGTTVRVYRPDEGIWRISFTETVGSIAAQLNSRVVGDEIVESTVWNAGDLPSKWIFSDVSKDRFRWRVQSPDGQVYLSTVADRVH